MPESKKTSVNLTKSNYEKMKKVIESEGMTQNDFINKAVENVPIIILGDRKQIAESFFDIRNALAEENIAAVRKEVNEVCQSLNTLIEKIGGSRISNG